MTQLLYTYIVPPQSNVYKKQLFYTQQSIKIIEPNQWLKNQNFLFKFCAWNPKTS